MLATSGAATAADVAIDVGGGYTIQTKDQPLKIALFAIGSNTSYLEAQDDEAKKVAKELGVALDTFYGDFDAAKQMDQMQVALSGGQYNAWIVQSASGEAHCDIATRQAPEANILVQTMGIVLCGRQLNAGDELWAPGTLNYVGGNETVAAWSALWKKAAADNPGPQKVGILVGPPLLSITQAFMKAMEEHAPKDWTMTPIVHTNYTVPDSQAKSLPLFVANPDITILMSAYTDITKGAVAALMASDQLGKMKIYEGGGTITGQRYIREGVTSAMLGRYSRSPIRFSIQALVDAWAGKKVPRYTSNDGHEDEVGREPGSDVFIVTKANVDNYHPQND
jgi:ribose transport system substrate-binding protein